MVLTSYNHARFLREAIESVLQQTYADFELIIWDDGSSDDSWEIIRSYSDPRIRAVRNETGKSGWGFRKAIGEVRSGEYIAIHHSDDVWEPQKLERQTAILDEHPDVGAVFSNALIIDEDGAPFTDASHFYYNIFDQPNRTRHEWLNFFFYRSNALCHPSILIRKVCFDDCGPYRFGFAQVGDMDMWVRLCLKYEIYVSPEKLIRFRVRSNEMNASGSRPDVAVRAEFEKLQIYGNYRKLETPEEFLKVFPTATPYFRQAAYDMGFALGMVALEEETPRAAKLFGLTLLFEALNDAGRAARINELYQFNHSDFIALSARHDVFSIRAAADLMQQLARRERELAELENSRAWKFALWMRRFRLALAPPNSPQAHVLGAIYRIVKPAGR